MDITRWSKSLRWVMLVSVMTWSASAIAQEAANPSGPTSSASALATESVSDSVRELREQVRELQAAVAGMRRELDEVRAGTQPQKSMLRSAAQIENSDVDASVQATTSGVSRGLAPASLVASVGTAEALSSASSPSHVNAKGLQEYETQKQDQKMAGHAASAEEEYQLLSGKVDDQYQTKVESASKYRLRLSGIVLMNLVSNQGVVDSIDLPTLAYARPPGDSGGSFGATLRQSEIGVEAFGPIVAGAKTRGDLQLDLAGGFPSVPNGIDSGLMRLRTATMRMDWANTSVVVGQDSIFFSPNSPTSFASLAIPALTYAGNLWSWVPQIRVEHRVDLADESSLLFQAGILDPVSGEIPGAIPGTEGITYYRQAGPGESSRQPAYGSRISWARNVFGQPLRVGGGGYFSPQDYGFGRTVDGWAGMADIELPLSHQFSLSGKIYRGKALGGLYGGLGRSVLFSDNPTLATTEVKGLNSVGGWAQLKYRPASKWEFNAAFGIDNPYAADLKFFPQPYEDSMLARNKGSFANMIYRPRSDLLFSAEYRHLRTYSLTEGGNNAGQLNLMMGVLF
jgi:hypothetical protein